MPRRLSFVLVLANLVIAGGSLRSAPRQVTFGAQATPVEAYDAFEITVTVEAPDVANCFTDARVSGELRAAGRNPVRADGFCDSRDGATYRVRFMPAAAGEYDWTVTYSQDGFERTGHGSITVVPGGRRGPVRVDLEHPYHFVWEGTGEHYFWQVNEEYGYEDHYPQGWGGNRTPPATNADSRRRLAWEMMMAGGYQTTGERADRGTGWGPDTGGGWVNGRGDDTMVMLAGYARMRDFFTSVPWWTTEPRPDLAGAGTRVLADPGGLYFVYHDRRS